MKVWVTCDVDPLPVCEFHLENFSEYAGAPCFEVDESTVERWNKAIDQYQEFQSELRELMVKSHLAKQARA